jgi:hypothetical protein
MKFLVIIIIYILIRSLKVNGELVKVLVFSKFELIFPASLYHYDDSRENQDGDYSVWSLFDVNDEIINQTYSKNNITGHEEDHHRYYNSTLFQNKFINELMRHQLAFCDNLTIHTNLSNSHQNKAVVKLPFEFNFYGHPVKNITIVTSGFIYTGDDYHSFISPSQYISPLMANFDSSFSNDSRVKLCQNGESLKLIFNQFLILKNFLQLFHFFKDESFHVYWENVYLQNKTELGPFSFSASINMNGQIDFNYFNLPVNISDIDNSEI